MTCRIVCTLIRLRNSGSPLKIHDRSYILDMAFFRPNVTSPSSMSDTALAPQSNMLPERGKGGG